MPETIDWRKKLAARDASDNPQLRSPGGRRRRLVHVAPATAARPTGKSAGAHPEIMSQKARKSAARKAAARLRRRGSPVAALKRQIRRAFATRFAIASRPGRNRRPDIRPVAVACVGRHPRLQSACCDAARAIMFPETGEASRRTAAGRARSRRNWPRQCEGKDMEGLELRIGRPPEVTCRRQDRGERRPSDFGETKKRGGPSNRPAATQLYSRGPVERADQSALGSGGRFGLRAHVVHVNGRSPRPMPGRVALAADVANGSGGLSQLRRSERRPLATGAGGDQKPFSGRARVPPGSARAAPAEERLSPSFACRSVFRWKGRLEALGDFRTPCEPPARWQDRRG